MKLLVMRFKGGEGSGHHGHKGIPGHHGGSLSSDTVQNYSNKLSIPVDGDLIKSVSKIEYSGSYFITDTDAIVQVKHNHSDASIAILNANPDMDAVGKSKVHAYDLLLNDCNFIRVNVTPMEVDFEVSIFDDAMLRRIQKLSDTDKLDLYRRGNIVMSDIKNLDYISYNAKDFMSASHVVRDGSTYVLKQDTKFKGGEGSGHFDHAGIPGHHGGSLPDDVNGYVKTKFVIPETAWYLNDWHEYASRERVQKWVEEVEARGWDVQELIDAANKGAHWPTSNNYDYSPEWGMKAETEYTVYRTGSIDKQPSGTYFGPTERDVSPYVENEEAVQEYTLKLHTPKVYVDKNEAWIDLLGMPSAAQIAKEKSRRQYWESEDFEIRPHLWAIQAANDKMAKNTAIDIRLARALEKKGYDSMVLLHPEPPCSREIMLVDSSKNLVKK